MNEAVISEVEIKCKDRIVLKGTLFRPDNPKAAILMAPATGIRRTFYHKFCAYVAAHGYAVLNFDNRGIGDSISGNINAMEASLINWGRYDMRAALNKLQEEIPGKDVHLMGHSAGGMLFGLMENAKDFKTICTYGCASGNIKKMDSSFRWKARLFMNGIIPVSNFLFGVTKSNWVRMGETLPKAVASQWRTWCNREGYILPDLDVKITDHSYYELNCPMRWIYAQDDPIVNMNTIEEVKPMFPSFSPEFIEIKPADYSYKSIGHMNFFRSNRKELWPLVLDWLEQH